MNEEMCMSTTCHQTSVGATLMCGCHLQLSPLPTPRRCVWNAPDRAEQPTRSSWAGVSRAWARRHRPYYQALDYTGWRIQLCIWPEEMRGVRLGLIYQVICKVAAVTSVNLGHRYVNSGRSETRPSIDRVPHVSRQLSDIAIKSKEILGA